MQFVPSTQHFINEAVVQVEKEVIIEDALEVRVKTAQEAALASTTAKAQAAYDEVYKKEMKRIEDEVKSDYIAEIEETITDPGY